MTLNDTCRFWTALASGADIVDDPQGLRHPLADRAAAFGMSPGQFSEACRTFQEIRTEKAGQGGKDGGIGHGLDFQGLDAGSQNFDLSQYKPLSPVTPWLDENGSIAQPPKRVES